MSEKKNPAMIVLAPHTLSYVHIKEPKAFEEGKTPMYSVTFLIDKDHPDVKKIRDTIKAVYAANKESIFKGAPLTSPKMWDPLRDGDEYLEDNPTNLEYAGKYFIKASSKSQPQAYDADKNEIFDLDQIYSGSICRGVIVCYPYNNVSKGHGFYINSVMKIDDGERLGGHTVSPDVYDEEDYEAPAKKRRPVQDDEEEDEAPARPAPRKPAAKKPAIIWDVDADDNDIYSEDGGKTWNFAD